ncbi:accessory Sec system protein Asp2 [Liquorilactobacillus aquaticus]|uniref:accessory Sec system protein Asp2 n=1 Tax=Liquorilactobacillus aquaticus TaxID=392566 RepID=UPI00070A4046|nr:accessory Sec system protein Asp2 [Liquorilactobacillus aquaticus]
MHYTDVIQLGGHKLGIEKQLDKSFRFHYLPLGEPEEVVTAEETLLSNDNLKLKYRSSIFILGLDSYVFLMPNLIKKLPSNRIIYSQNENLTVDLVELLQKKCAEPIKFEEAHTIINEIFFGGQYGLRLDFEKIDISPLLKNQIEQFGRGEINIKDVNLVSQVQAISWRMTISLNANSLFEFWPEYELKGKGKVIFKLYIIDAVSYIPIKTYEIFNKKTPEPFLFKTGENRTILYVAAFLQGSIEKFSIREIHIRKSRAKHGNFMVNSSMIADRKHCNGQLAVYFDSGDFKPPLNVYFSGWRTAEGFEGAGIMNQVGGGGVPHLLIADERLKGGAFYIGSREFEAEVVSTISKYLKYLGFSKDQLVLSGISMGTTAALYYSSMLSPKAVIVGKPLVNLGTIAANERIDRPYGFPTSLDLLLLNEKTTSYDAQQHFNERFWSTFRKGKFKNTMFAIAYMKQDDYDSTAFDELFKFLKNKYPYSKITYKGLVGRHNDNTVGIVNWFMRQFENIMEEGFDRRSSNIE